MPIDEDALTGVLDEAAENDIIIIIIGRNSGKCPSAIYVDFDYAGTAEHDANLFLNNYWNNTDDFNVLIFACNSDHGDIYYQTLTDILLNYVNISRDVFRVDDVDEISTCTNGWLNDHNGVLPDAIFTCCDLNAQAVLDALIAAGFTFTPGGIPIYGFKPNCTHHYVALAERILDLIQKTMSGEINAKGMTFLVGICHCSD